MKPTEYARRRKQLMQMMGPGSIAIIPAASEKVRNGDAHYPYRQDSDFRYLTGFPEPEAVAVLIPGRKQAEYVLFCRERNPAMETWNGRRAGQQGAIDDHGADDAFPITDIDEILPGMLEQVDRVFYTMGNHPEFDQRLIGWVNHLRAQVRTGTHTPAEFVSLDHLLHDMRLVKSREEVATMRRAAKISAGAHKRAMRACRPGLNEFEVEAELLHEFHRNGGEPAYTSIVGGGENACILHYVENNAPLKDGDLLLVDAGTEFDGYASDITRTFPVNGRYSEAQRAVYEVVLKAQLAAIDQVRAGNHWNDPHDAAVKALTQGLVKLGLLKGNVPQLIKSGAYRKFYMHRTGHWIGMDVHDVGDYKIDDQWRVLEPGMVLTIEPGLYIAPGTKGVPKKWWGIGVRIEDDVLVTRGEPDVLSADVPKTPDEIEALMRAA
ncbi:MAG: Xaa-Pro aminopeptidase [Gammaproteobacteria bacterium]